MRNSFRQVSICLLLGALTTACAVSAPRASADLAVASVALAGSALDNAELAGAREHAPVKFRLAREKKAAADKAIDNNEFDKARTLGVEARADAELARAASDAEKARKELVREHNKIEVLDPEVLRVLLDEAEEAPL